MGLSEFESNLTQADLQARRQGENQYAQTKTQQNQIEGQRQAAFNEADMQYEAAVEQRKNQLKATVGKLAGTAAGIAVGQPMLGAAIGGAAGGLLGGGGGAVSGAGAGLQAGYISGQNKGSATPQQPQITTPTTDNSAIDAYNNIMGKSGFGKIIADLPQGQPSSNNTGQTSQKPSLDQLSVKGAEFRKQQMRMGIDSLLKGTEQSANINTQRQYDFSGGAQNIPNQPFTEQEQGKFLESIGYNPDGTPKNRVGGAGGEDRNVDALFEPQTRQGMVDEWNRIRNKPKSEVTREEFQRMQSLSNMISKGTQPQFGTEQGYNTQEFIDDIGYGLGKAGDFFGNIGTSLFGSQEEKYKQYINQ